MPICPGCERRVAYDQLVSHERYCTGIRNDAGAESLENLDRRLASLERQLDERVDAIEADLKQRLARAEAMERSRESPT